MSEKLFGMQSCIIQSVCPDCAASLRDRCEWKGETYAVCSGCGSGWIVRPGVVRSLWPHLVEQVSS